MEKGMRKWKGNNDIFCYFVIHVTFVRVGANVLQLGEVAELALNPPFCQTAIIASGFYINIFLILVCSFLSSFGGKISNNTFVPTAILEIE